MESWSWWQWAVAVIGVWLMFYRVGDWLNKQLRAIEPGGVTRTNEHLGQITALLRNVEYQTAQLSEITALLREIKSALGKPLR